MDSGNFAAATAAAIMLGLLAAPAQALNLPSPSGVRVDVGQGDYGGAYFTEAERERTTAEAQWTAWGSLEEGSIYASIYTLLDPPCRLNGCNWGGTATVMQWDIIDFESTGLQAMTFSFDIDGERETRGGSAGAKGFFYFGTDLAHQEGRLFPLSQSEHFAGKIQLAPGRTKVAFVQAIEVSAARGGYANYGDGPFDFAGFGAAPPRGVTFSWDLPEGVTYQSSSGVFMANKAPPPSAAPEPATWAMMILGFGGAGMVLRRRRASPQRVA